MTIQEYWALPKQTIKAKELVVGMFYASAYKFTRISEVRVMSKTVKVGYKIPDGRTLYWHFKADQDVQIKKS